MRTLTWPILTVAALAAAPVAAQSMPSDPKAIVAELDSQYQAAVKANDAANMDRILAPDMILVTGRGAVVPRDDLIKAAAAKDYIYEKQDPSQRTVRLYGEKTAIVTALLWIKGTSKGTAFDYKLWYSDTYVLTPGGWRYAFGMASLRLPEQ